MSIRAASPCHPGPSWVGASNRRHRDGGQRAQQNRGPTGANYMQTWINIRCLNSLHTEMLGVGFPGCSHHRVDLDDFCPGPATSPIRRERLFARLSYCCHRGLHVPECAVNPSASSESSLNFNQPVFPDRPSSYQIGERAGSPSVLPHSITVADVRKPNLGQGPPTLQVTVQYQGCLGAIGH